MASAFFINAHMQAIPARIVYAVLRRILGEQSGSKAMRPLWGIFPHFSAISEGMDREMHFLERKEGRYYFPSRPGNVENMQVAFGWPEWLGNKYTHPDFVDIDAGDIVVDCGAYAGGFSLYAARKGAAEIHAFDPSRTTLNCYDRNTRGLSAKIISNCQGLFSHSGTMNLNLSDDPTNHSFIDPDELATGVQEAVEVVSLDDYCKNRRLTRIDFLKLEAEGVEYEILQGVKEILPKKIAIDVSPETFGHSPADEIETWAKDHGYETLRRNGFKQQMLFARLMAS